MTIVFRVSNELSGVQNYSKRAEGRPDSESDFFSPILPRRVYEVAEAVSTGTLETANLITSSEGKDGASSQTVKPTIFEAKIIKRYEAAIKELDTHINKLKKDNELILSLIWDRLAYYYKLKGKYSRGSNSKESQESYTRALNILRELVGNTADNKIEDFQEKNSSKYFKLKKEEAKRFFYLSGVSLAETYLALRRYGEAKATLENLTKIGELETDQYFSKINAIDLKLRVYLAKVAALKGIAQDQKDKKKETTLNEAKKALEAASKLITEGIPKVEAAIGAEEDAEKKEDLGDLKEGFLKNQKIGLVSMAEIQLALKDIEGVLASIKDLAGVEKPGVKEIQDKLPTDVWWDEVDRFDLIRRAIFVEVDALKAKALATKDKTEFQNVVKLLQGLQNVNLVKPATKDKTGFQIFLELLQLPEVQDARLIRHNTEDHIRYYVSLAEAQLGAKDFKGAQEAIAVIAQFPKGEINFIDEEVLKNIITDDKKRLDYLCRANLVLTDAIKGKVMPGDIAPLALADEEKALLNKSKALLGELEKLLDKTVKQQPTDTDIAQYLKTVQVSMTEIELGLKNYKEALAIVIKATGFEVPKDNPRALPTSKDIEDALAFIPKEREEVRIDLIKRFKDVKFWASFSQIGDDLNLLPSGREEMDRILVRGDDEAKAVKNFMGESTPSQKLDEIRISFKVLEGQFNELPEEDKKKKTGQFEVLSAWLKLKTFEIVKNDEITGKDNSRDLLAQLKAGEYLRAGEKVKVPDKALPYDNPKKPLDGSIYSILRELVVEDEKITVIAKKVPSDKDIQDAVDFQLKANVIDEAEAKELKSDYQKNFAKIRSWINEIMLGGKLKQESEKVEKYFKELGIE